MLCAPSLIHLFIHFVIFLFEFFFYCFLLCTFFFKAGDSCFVSVCVTVILELGMKARKYHIKSEYHFSLASKKFSLVVHYVFINCTRNICNYSFEHKKTIKTTTTTKNEQISRQQHIDK